MHFLIKTITKETKESLTFINKNTKRLTECYIDTDINISTEVIPMN